MHQFPSSPSLQRLDALLSRAELDALLHGKFPESRTIPGVHGEACSLHAPGLAPLSSQLTSGLLPYQPSPRHGTASFLF